MLFQGDEWGRFKRIFIPLSPETWAQMNDQEGQLHSWSRTSCSSSKTSSQGGYLFSLGQHEYSLLELPPKALARVVWDISKFIPFVFPYSNVIGCKGLECKERTWSCSNLTLVTEMKRKIFGFTKEAFLIAPYCALAPADWEESHWK